MFSKKVLLIAVSFLPLKLFAWGDIGHRTVGEIAERHLTEKARAGVHAILGDESLAEAATWPDEVRSDFRYNFSTPWHFVEVPTGTEYDDTKAAPGGNALQAMIKMEQILRGKVEPMKFKEVTVGKKEAIRFLTHFVGDVHQPLHVGNGKDMGANKCVVKWFDDVRRLNSFWNLHSVWDDGLIDSLRLSFSELAKFLDHDIPPAEVARLQQSTYLDWVNESKTLRPSLYPQLGKEPISELDQPYCQKYSTPDKYGKNGRLTPQEIQKQMQDLELAIKLDPEIPNLAYEYKFQFVPLMKKQILTAGIRLAGVMNRVFE